MTGLVGYICFMLLVKVSAVQLETQNLIQLPHIVLSSTRVRKQLKSRDSQQ